MHQGMTDQEIRALMRQAARLSGLELSEERLEADLQHFKRHLEAIEAVAGVELDREDEPVPTFRLDPGAGKVRGRTP